jgi:tRNA pseudouridine55 synthase
MTDALVVVDKPAGWTSHDVVGKLRRIYGTRRVGHAGTLDPDATGVLLVGIGRVTRFLQERDKSYRGDVVFGIATDTLDAAGAVLEQVEMPISRGELDAVVPRFIGDIEQIPPMVSALKVNGRKLYELARKGEVIERDSRPVHIESLVVLEFQPGAYPVATIEVTCGSGTYIRSLAADLGSALGGPAHLRTLRRLRVGSFGLDCALTIEQIEADPAAAIMTPAAAMGDMPKVEVDDDQARAISHGVLFPRSTFEQTAALNDSPIAMLNAAGDLLAVYQRRGASLRPVVVLAASGEGL